MFRPVEKRTSLSATVEVQIEDAIRDRSLTAGKKLPSEMELAEQFGVSRTVIREALRTLSARGYISVEKGRGIFVKGFTGEAVTAPLHNYLRMNMDRGSVLDIVHARQIMEPSIAAASARHRTTEDLDVMGRNIEDLRAHEGDFAELAKLDMAFHLAIARATKNFVLPLLLEPIHRLMPDIKSSVYATVADAKDSAVTWHEKILAAIASGDSDAAFLSMTEHLKIAEDHAERMLKARRDVVSDPRPGAPLKS